MGVKSPVTLSENVLLEKRVLASEIISSYQKTLHINISHFFNGLEFISIYKCLDSGYRFYYPFNITGDGKFYEKLQEFDWYYMPRKWEHNIAEKIIKANDKVLEIGCAHGDFLHDLSKLGIQCRGLELNKSAVEEGSKRGVEVLNESIQEHAEKNSSYYDVVCSFQVTEHIPDVRNFIHASIDAVKPGGHIIISVPNMSSIYKYFEQINLNTPPHHMGLWDEYSLKRLELFFPVTFLKYYIEPLQKYHVANYASVMSAKLNVNRFKFLSGFLKKYAVKWYSFVGSQFGSRIKGLTLLAVFQKK